MRTLPVARIGRTTRQLALLDRLVGLLVTEGFDHLTMDELASRMRCSKTTLYQLADSRHELVVEAVKQYFRAAVEAVEAQVAAEREPAARVVAYLTAVAGELQPLSRAFMQDLTTFAPAAAVYRQNTAAAADRIRSLVAEGVEAGTFRSVNAAFAGEMVAATMFEIQRGEVFDRIEMSDSEAYAELASWVLHGLVP